MIPWILRAILWIAIAVGNLTPPTVPVFAQSGGPDCRTEEVCEDLCDDSDDIDDCVDQCLADDDDCIPAI